MQKIIKTTLILLIAINFLYALSGTTNYTFTSIDSYSIWLFKAKAFFIENRFPFKTLSNPNYIYSHPQYPILLPFLISQIYKIAGHTDEPFILSLYPLIYIAIILLTFISLKTMKMETLPSLFFTYLYSMLSPLLAQGGRMHAGNADIIITFLYWVAFLTMFYFYKTKKEKHFWILIFLIIISSQIKQEGLFLGTSILFLPISKKKKILGITLSLIPTFMWWQFVKSHFLPQSFGITLYPLPILLSRFLLLLKTVFKELLNIKNWYVFWPIYWLLFYLQKGNSKFLNKVIRPYLFSYLALITCVYLFSTLEISKYAGSSFDRILLQVSPFFYPLFASRCLKFIRNTLIKNTLEVL